MHMTQLLIVDDEAQIAHGIAELLQWEDIGIGAVHKAYSAAQALELMAVHSIGIVITDIRMPDMDGIALLRRIKDRWKKTKVIMLTGYADFEYAQEAIQGQAVDYLLKPVRKETLHSALSRVLEQMSREWEEIASAHQAMKTLRGYMPELKKKLLSDLATGFRYSQGELEEKLEWFSLPFKRGDGCYLLLVRPEMPARVEDMNGRALLEYSLENIAHETFRDEFDLWTFRDAHGHLVFLVKPAVERALSYGGLGGEEADEADEADRSKFYSRSVERCAIQFHHHAKQFLQTDVTIFVGTAGQFPYHVSSMYEQALSAVRKRRAQQEPFLVRLEESGTSTPSYSRKLHEPPLFQHLFEIGDWEAIGRKLKEALEWADESDGCGTEHLAEVFFTFSAALCAYLHRQGRPIAESLGSGYDRMIEGSPMWSRHRLQEWADEVLDMLREQAGEEPASVRSEMIGQIQQYMRRHLSEELSLQRLADHVFLHPTHLSKIYKQETGEGISEYLTRLRMERAAYLLGHTDTKIYEVGCETGYVNANYFIKVFRKQFGTTPQEYREKIRRGLRKNQD